ncbi:hypothetical protein NDU88_005584 [Pleurodeles waltl]|uniref:Uncharacterized protein n=1 Tax=Pleurodeles waltl TaxID=8319 RepID=A0AAV7QHK3_PLEWA|nr:hypothetical protein NDU88_005584 [Pleurodeles waltl]
MPPRRSGGKRGPYAPERRLPSRGVAARLSMASEIAPLSVQSCSGCPDGSRIMSGPGAESELHVCHLGHAPPR